MEIGECSVYVEISNNIPFYERDAFFEVDHKIKMSIFLI
jgi:hypothetical protein